MVNKFKKVMFAFVLLLVVAFTSAWQSGNNVLAAQGIPETPLAPGLTWKNLGQSARNIQLNVQGDSLDLSGETFLAAQKYTSGVPQDVADFYSNVELYKSGWSSDNAFEAPEGVHRIFYHDSGFYLAVEVLKCADDASSTCITIWKSAQKDTAKFTPGKQPQPAASTAATFNKSTPTDGSTGINPGSVYLSWTAYSGVEKYSYCVKEGSECASNDPNWTGTMLNRSITISGLSSNKIYYWNVKAITCMSCVPKTFQLADGGTWWKFTTAITTSTISGNAGVGGAILSYYDVSSKTVTADTSGNYSFSVSYNWTGTVTPSKNGYAFVPVSRNYATVTSNQTGQSYIAVPVITISGNAGVAGALLSYTDGTPKSVSADSSGNYSLTVSPSWTGRVTPSKAGFAFTPAYIDYSNVSANMTGQNYTAAAILYTISGNAGVAGATLSYIDGTAKTALADATGQYSFQVPYNWSGTVTPSKYSYVFSPVNRFYTNVLADQTGQNFSASVITYTNFIYLPFVVKP